MRQRYELTVAVTCVLLGGALLGACGHDDATGTTTGSPDASTDTTKPAVDSSPGDDDAGPCTDLALEGTTVVIQDLTDAGADADADAGATIPIPAGGTIVDGTYVLESAVLYRGSPPQTLREVIRVTGDLYEIVTEQSAAPPLVHGAFHFETSGALLSFPAKVCIDPPGGSIGPAKYEATANALELQYEGPARAIRWHYARKP